MTTTRSAFTARTDSREAADELLAALHDLTGLHGVRPRVIVFFAGIHHDGALLGDTLAARFPDACVLGCSTNGEFSETGHGKGGAAALAIGDDRIGACACALAEVSEDLERGLARACEAIAARIGAPLRELDPSRHVGLALLEGAHGREEAINAALGDLAPLLRFVGGSAGDDIRFTGTWAYADGRCSSGGTALLVAEMRTPFEVFKTCHFEPTDRSVVVTRSERRTIHELDGRPAAAYYAELIGRGGRPVDQLGFADFLANPLGLMIDGEAWLRSLVRVEGDGLFLACAVAEGTRLNLMRPTNLLTDTRARIDRARHSLGAIDGALLFNCAYRMIEADITGQVDAYHATLSAMTHAGMQSNGESYLGHINQTLTGLVWS